MTRRPLIGLTGRRTTIANMAAFPDTLRDLDLFLADDARGVIEAGGLPMFLPLDLDPGDLVEHLDGLLLTGGADVEPARYGQRPHPESTWESERDRFELSLFVVAERSGLPILGICRGLQLVNVALGGTLRQHVPAHAGIDDDPRSPVHRVTFSPGSMCHELYGPSTIVNTLHHQCIDQVAEGVDVVGVSDDGVIEAIEAGSALLALQWHPEMLESRSEDPAFAWLVERARTR